MSKTLAAIVAAIGLGVGCGQDYDPPMSSPDGGSVVDASKECSSWQDCNTDVAPCVGVACKDGLCNYPTTADGNLCDSGAGVGICLGGSCEPKVDK